MRLLLGKARSEDPSAASRKKPALLLLIYVQCYIQYLSPYQGLQLSEKCPFITFFICFGMLRPQFYILKRNTFARKAVFIMAYREPEKEDRNEDNCSPRAVLPFSSAEGQANLIQIP